MEALQQERKNFESLGMIYPPHDQVKVEKVILAGIENYWFTPPQLTHDEVVIYLHGGGFIYGSIASHRAMISHFAAATGRRFLFVEYPLAPEKSFPHAVHETTEVIRELQEQIPGLSFILMGDSAGGNLAMSLALNLKKLSMPAPQAQVLISPWTNMKPEYASYQENEKKDPIITKSFVEYAAALYTGGVHLTDPLASPVLGAFTEFAPTLTLVGNKEVLRDDAVWLHQALLKAGNNSTLEIFPDVTHVWPLSDVTSADSVKALTSIRKFMDSLVSIPVSR